MLKKAQLDGTQGVLNKDLTQDVELLYGPYAGTPQAVQRFPKTSVALAATTNIAVPPLAATVSLAICHVHLLCV